MPRFYCHTPLVSDTELELPSGPARHVQVLRLQPGDTITLFNAGHGVSDQAGEFDATITHMGRSDVQVKVGATDEAGIRQVTVAYLNPSDPNHLQTQDLTFDAAAQVWSGVFRGSPATRFFVQVVDQAGNVTTAHNKGRYYSPSDGMQRTLPLPTCSGACVFLPAVMR